MNRKSVGLLALLLVVGGAVAVLAVRVQGGDRRESAAPKTQASATQDPPVTTTTTTTTLPAEPPHQVSLQALMQMQFDGRELALGRVLARTNEYTRHFVTYKSGPLAISGVMNVPNGNGPFPALVLNHGYIDPDVYVNGQGLRREQEFLARRGFVVLHTDYRNHAESDDDPDAEMKLRLGYVEDVVNAVMALRNSSLPYIDRERIGLLGRSMGGGVTLTALVVKPDLVDAAVVYAPVSSDYVDNFNRWTRSSGDRRQLAERVIAAYGSPEENPGFWKNISAVNFFDRITRPILIHHGTADESVPIDWSRKTLAALQSHNKQGELLTYEGERHAFDAAWPASMERTVSFFQAHL